MSLFFYKSPIKSPFYVINSKSSAIYYNFLLTYPNSFILHYYKHQTHSHINSHIATPVYYMSKLTSLIRHQ